MNRFLINICALFLLLFTACQKERGYTGFVDATESAIPEISISTDKAIYKPGEIVKFSLENASSGSRNVRYRHLGEILDDQPLTSDNWTWVAPDKDYTGYLVEVYLYSGNVEEVLATIAVDVSSDWKKFPRYGFLSSYQKMSDLAVDKVINKLNRYHINGVQFQDWHYKHHWPLAQDDEGNPLESYLDIASRTSHLSTIKKYIDSIHKYGMKAIFYNLCFGALDDALEDGVNEKWSLYLDDNAEEKAVHELSEPFKSSIYIMNPANEDWQKYLLKRNSDIYKELEFDGYQIDQLGDRGLLYDYAGDRIKLDDTYGNFINAMKNGHPDKELIMNAVTQYGSENIIKTGKVSFAYNEVWEDKFSDLIDIIEKNNSFRAGGIPTVFAAYMNYDVGSGYFNTPGVLLADAVMFAAGGSHLELGEHMLTTEYFPNNNMAMKPELEKSIIVYYDFMTAYQNLLRDGGEFNKVSISSENIKIKSWEPALGYVVTICKKFSPYQVVHLLNFTDADSVSWKDSLGTMPEPERIERFSITMDVTEPVERIWMASPDSNLGVPSELDFDQDSGRITVEVPSLKYWDMLVIEYKK